MLMSVRYVLVRLVPLAVFFCASLSIALAQDSRVVTEPVFPVSCTVLTAQLPTVNGDLPSSAETSFDTARIQSAIAACPQGQAVELAADDAGNNAFLIQPITIAAGVTLLVDAGVTVFASRNPRDYEVSPGACGVIASTSTGCQSILTVKNAPNAAIMGFGKINGRGGDTLLGPGTPVNTSWWDLARDAQTQNLSQNVPKLLSVSGSSNFTLYKITLTNSPTFHVAYSGGPGIKGFTVWGIKIIAPFSARNTDGIDPGNATDVTITNSYISDGDDNVAVGASHTLSSNLSIINDHFYSGHGMSIGSFTSGGVNNMLVDNVQLAGNASDGNANGIRIKSANDRGGTISNVTYSHMCIKNIRSPLQFNPFYNTNTGTLIPNFQSITLSNVHVLSEGRVQINGADASHPLGLTLDNVVFDSLLPSDLTPTPQFANITAGPGPVSSNLLNNVSGVGVNVTTNIADPGAAPYDCSHAFVYLAGELTGPTNAITTGQLVNLTAIVQPVVSGAALPTGIVQITEGDNVAGTATLFGSSDLIAIALPNAAPGTHIYSANYLGDSNYAPLKFGAFSVTVTTNSLTATQTQISGVPPNSVFGASIPVTATVASSGAGTPTGSVTFLQGNNRLATIPLSSGQASFVLTGLVAGSYVISAAYNGDTTFSGSTSTASPLTVSPTGTTTSLVSSASEVIAGGTVTLTTTVNASFGVPTGNVNFMDGTTQIGTAALVNGVATVNAALPTGSHSIVAVYAGSQNYATSSSLAVMVNVIANPGNGISALPAPLPYTITTVAGGAAANCTTSTSAVGDGCLATQVALSTDLRAVAADNFGNLLVADTNNNRIRSINAATGVITTLAGGGTACTSKTDSYGDGCPAAQTGNFNHPRGLWTDAAGNVFIAGYGSNLIHEIQASSGKMVQIAGLVSGTGSGTSGVGADNVPATTSALNTPRGVWTDNNGNIYIGDTGNNKIRVVYVGGAIPNVNTPVVGNIYTIAGNGTAGTAGDGGPANASGVQVRGPQGGVTDANGNVFLSDGGGRVRVVYMSGVIVAKLIATENPGTTAQAGFIYSIAGGGSPYTAPALATSVSVGGPQKLALDAGNNLYIGDSSANSVWFLDIRSGFLRRLVGGAATVCSTATDAVGDGCPGTQATISSGGNGLGVALDNKGNLYVTDTTNRLVRKVSLNTQFGPTAVGGSLTQTMWMHYIVGDGPAASNSFSVPASFQDFSLSGSPSCTSNSDGTADCLFQVQFSPAAPGARSAPLTAMSSAGARANFGLRGLGMGAGGALDPSAQATIGEGLVPQGIAIDSGMNSYVADGASRQVLKYAPGSSAGVSLVGGLSDPHGIVADAAGNIYVADAGAGKVLQVAPDGTVKSVGTGLRTPQGLAVDQYDNIYIADSGQSRIIKLSSNLFSQTTLGSGFSTPTAIAVDAGSNVYVADSGTGTITKLGADGTTSTVNSGAVTPAGLAIDAGGNLYVADTGASPPRVLQVSTVAGGVAHTVVSGLTEPQGVAVDGVGNVYVADTGNTGVLEMRRTHGSLVFPDATTILAETLSSIGNQPIVPAGNGFTQTDATNFNLSTSGSGGCNFAANLASGATCSLTAQFTPQSTGTFADVATLTGNYANLQLAPPPVLRLTLSGAGTKTFATTVNLAPISPDSPVFGQGIILSATVTSSGGTPTGDLTFSIDGIPLAPLVLDGSGVATTTISNLAAGQHALNVLYSGDTVFSGSNAGPVLFSVGRAGTSLTWSPPASDIPYGTPLAAVLNAVGSAAGTVAYTAQSSSSGPTTVTPTTILAVGLYQLSATFTPADSIDFNASTAGITLTVSQASTLASLGVTQSVVAADGTGNFSTVSAGVQSLPSTGGALYIKPGTYTEAVVIKTPNVALYGLGGDPTKVILTDNLSAGPNNFNGKLGDQGSATVQALGSNFYADYITFQNTFDIDNGQNVANGQALAVFVNSDRAVFNHDRFISRQDTLFGGSKGCNSTFCIPARQYFFGSYVEGNVDYIFGDGATVFETSTIHTVYHGSAQGEATITAQNKRFTGSGSYLSGEVFSNCTLTSESDNGPMTNLFLGRPWGTFSTNVFLNTNMQAPVNGSGWIEFTPGTTNNLPTSFYAEYNSTGPGSLGPRESFAVQLTAATAAPWQPLTFLAGTDGWNPQTTLAQRASAVVPPTQSLTVPQGANFTLITRIAPVVSGAPTGTIQFLDSGVLIATADVDASGEASLPSSALQPGRHSITIQYSGDANFTGSTSAPVNIIITSTTTTALSVSPAAPMYGQSVNVSATVTPQSGANTPTGTVSLTVDGNPAGSATLSAGSAAFTVAGLSAGPHALAASYSGDDESLSSSSIGSVTLAQAPLTVTAGSATRVYGQINPAFTFTVTGFVNGDSQGTLIPNPPTLSTAATAGSPVGSYDIVAALDDPQGRLTNYRVIFINGTLTVGPAALAVAVNSKTRPYGSVNPLFDGTVSGLQNGDIITAVFSSTAVPGSPVGSYAITFSLSDPGGRLGNYVVAGANGVLVISPVPLTITADSQAQILHAPTPLLTASYLGFVLADNPSTLQGALTCSTTATAHSPVGTYPITCSGQTSNNYNITYVPGTLKIAYAALGRCLGEPGHSILPPIAANGTSVFEERRPVPAEFRVCDAQGKSIGTPGVVESFALIQVINAGDRGSDSDSRGAHSRGSDSRDSDSRASNSGDSDSTGDARVLSNIPFISFSSSISLSQDVRFGRDNDQRSFRWDPAEREWTLSINTRTLDEDHIYVFRIGLNDGSNITFQFGLR